VRRPAPADLLRVDRLVLVGERVLREITKPPESRDRRRQIIGDPIGEILLPRSSLKLLNGSTTIDRRAPYGDLGRKADAWSMRLLSADRRAGSTRCHWRDKSVAAPETVWMQLLSARPSLRMRRNAATWTFRFCPLPPFRQTASMRSSLETRSPARSTSTLRMSRAREADHHRREGTCSYAGTEHHSAGRDGTLEEENSSTRVRPYLRSTLLLNFLIFSTIHSFLSPFS